MSGGLGMDVRLPIGMLFAVLGAVLVVHGVTTAGNAAMYQPSQGININLWWGAVMLVFGIVFIAMYRSAAARDRAIVAAARAGDAQAGGARH